MPDTFTMRLLDLLSATAAELVERLEADACAVSRVIGDVLIMVAECVAPGSTLQLGQGYIVPDYPQTEQVLSTRVPYTVTLDDENADPAEAGVLRELGFGSLLMLPLDLGGTDWGLVEIYRIAPRPFGESDVSIASAILAAVSTQTG